MASSPVALFVSPHLDDVAFSCAGTLAGWVRRGGRAVVATVFTRSFLNPAGFALACQLDKGLPAEVDYMALRRHEDSAFGRALRVDRLDWLDLLEAPHRGYDSAPALFAGVRADDGIARDVGGPLDRLVAELDPAWIFAPQAIGNHADHLQVVRSVLDYATWRPRVVWYRDLPYAAKFPEALGSPDLPENLVEVVCPLDSTDLVAKLAGSACYSTQVPFQFGDSSAVVRVLGGFAAAEGDRLGAGGPVEAFRVAPESVAAWIAGWQGGRAGFSPHRS